MTRKILLFIIMCMPFIAIAADNTSQNIVQSDINAISEADSIDKASENLRSAFEKLQSAYQGTELSQAVKQEEKTNVEKIINRYLNSESTNNDSDKNAKKEEPTEEKKESDQTKDERTEEEKKQALEEKQKAYDDAKAKEQSTANKTLTALTTAATGIGGMELAMGLSQQKADKAADADMAAYIETMRCTYGKDKQVKAGPEEIELPGGNNQQLMQLRSEYVALANDLKERKLALSMAPGIESEEILDKAQMNLYDQENVGITSGSYESLYRAKMLDSEEDQAKIAANAKSAKNRVIAGAVVGGVGVVGGIVGNSLINGKLGELIKNKNAGKSLKAAAKIESDALEDLQKCLSKAGVKNANDLKFDHFYPSVLSIKGINCSKDLTNITNQNATNLFEDSTDKDRIYEQLVKSFGTTNAGTMIGVKLSSSPTNNEKTAATNKIEEKIKAVEKRFKDAATEDSKRDKSSGFDFSSLLSNIGSGGNIASGDIMGLVTNGLGNITK